MFLHTRRVEFADTDMAGIVHFSMFFRYMEEAEHAFLRSVGLSVVMHDNEGPYGFPRVAATCDYRGPIRFEDILDIEVRVVHRGVKSVRYAFRMTHAGRDVADGTLTAVCCRLHHGQKPVSFAIPDWIAAKLPVETPAG